MEVATGCDNATIRSTFQWFNGFRDQVLPCHRHIGRVTGEHRANESLTVIRLKHIDATTAANVLKALLPDDCFFINVDPRSQSVIIAANLQQTERARAILKELDEQEC